MVLMGGSRVQIHPISRHMLYPHVSPSVSLYIAHDLPGRTMNRFQDDNWLRGLVVMASHSYLHGANGGVPRSNRGGAIFVLVLAKHVCTIVGNHKEGVKYS
jgi:hypothetical protein